MPKVEPEGKYFAALGCCSGGPSGNWPKALASPTFTRMLRKFALVLSVMAGVGIANAQPSAATAEPQAPPTERPASAGKIQIWTVGDSTAQPIAQGIERNVRDQPAFAVRTYFRNSSGLARPEYFDWHKTASALLRKDVPHIAVLSVGANDTQGLNVPGRFYPVPLLTPEWRQEYERRVEALVRLFTDKGVRVFLVLQPFDPSKKYSAWMADINSALRDAGSRIQGVTLVDSPTLLASPNGEYSNTAQDSRGNRITLRGDDGLHLTGTGGGYLAKRILRAMEHERLVPLHSSGLDAEGRAIVSRP